MLACNKILKSLKTAYPHKNITTENLKTKFGWNSKISKQNLYWRAKNDYSKNLQAGGGGEKRFFYSVICILGHFPKIRFTRSTICGRIKRRSPRRCKF